MSHFRVLSIGNVVENMQSYNEQDESYFEHVDRTEEDKKDYEEHAEGRGFKEFFEDWCGADTIYVKEDERECYGCIPQNSYCVVKRNDNGTEELLASYGWWNPYAKYDYYTEYSEVETKKLLILKNENLDPSDVSVFDVDWKAMLENAKEERRNCYKHIVEILGHTPAHKPFTWFEKEIADEKEARKSYEMQEDVKNFLEKEKPFFCRFDILDNYLCSEDEYAQKAALPFMSINIDGNWIEKGKVGWFGCVSDEKTEGEWSSINKEIVERLTTDEYLQDLKVTILDCHI